MATNSKNKNKLRWFIGIVVGILVMFAGVLGLWYITAVNASVNPGFWKGAAKIGRWTYKKNMGGKLYYYTSFSDYSNFEIREETAEFLIKYGLVLLVAGIALCMLLLVAFLRSKRIWKDTETPHRKGIAYVAELVLAALMCLPWLFHKFEWYFEQVYTWQEWETYQKLTLTDFMPGFVLPVLGACIYFFFCIWYLRPLFVLGVKGYVKEYSLLYLIVKACAKGWRRFVEELDVADFSKKTVKLLRKAVLIQFVILLVISLICVFSRFVGIPLLIVYSIALFLFLKKRYKKTEREYQEVLREVEEISAGDLSGQTEGDFGKFRSLGEGLARIKEGFRTAVEEEVKSERMKTELITNVSHDLKTPLTAILTYVELLKREEITEEERSSYIETLEKKSNRLKVLIEDLFEVSKAASNNVELQYTEVDLVKMVKQAAVEYEELFEKANLSLRQTMPEEACMVYVDGQKTYRIFENLFINISKYAMPGSRVFVRVYEKMGWYYAELKNVSAMELTVDAEELTERFVRGDASRNTEGSGLGLAIAKSLTQVQGGSFHIETDGDLFKVELGFPRLMYEEAKEEQRENVECQE